MNSFGGQCLTFIFCRSCSISQTIKKKQFTTEKCDGVVLLVKNEDAVRLKYVFKKLRESCKKKKKNV